MPYLLDVNVLIALFDPAHIHHDDAHAWLASEGQLSWATCPITENGFVRVVSNPAYPGRRTTVADAAERLRRFTGEPGHVFWPDDISLLDADVVDAGRLSGHREVTDTYLLALAVRRGCILVTFDRSVRAEAVHGEGPDAVVVLPAG